MKYLGEERQVQVKTEGVRDVLYIRCDSCGKKIMPVNLRDKDGRYIHIHTWHSDWGNDSIDSHEYNDYCTDCAKSFIADYIENANGTEELELENRYLTRDETHRGGADYFDGYALAKNDHKE